MKRVLLLSCSTGQGHNSCALAVKEFLDEQNITCEIKDALTFVSPQVSDFMSWGHCFMYRHLPGMFRWGYGYSEKHPAVFKENSGIYKMLTSGAEHIYQFITQGQFDVIICTHLFSALILNRILKGHSIQAKTAFIATDYTCYPGMEFCNLQHYFVPSECLVNEFEKSGISREHIIAAGIPVCRKMYDRTDKADAKRLLGIGSQNRHLLVMCGSMGCGPIAKIVKQLSKGLADNMEVSVICGTNRQLQRRLEQKYKRNEKIHIIGYTGQMSLYMDSADLLLTKPGGISITEAAVKKLPMAFVNAVAGCEQYNMDFFVEMGAAVTSDSAKELAEQSIRILESDTQRKKMEDALQNYRYLGGAGIIFKELDKKQEKAGQYFLSDAGSNGTYEKGRYGRLQGIQVS
ncbi:MAG: glycosyltransferase [Clostridium sp.]|nr:glycosyltransferase [Clostridium sp.]